MGPRLGNGISPCFFAFLRDGIWQAIPKSFLFFGENFLLLVSMRCWRWLRKSLSVLKLAGLFSCGKLRFLQYWKIKKRNSGDVWSSQSLDSIMTQRNCDFFNNNLAHIYKCMNTINSVSANIPCTQETGIYNTNNGYFSDKLHMTTTTKQSRF